MKLSFIKGDAVQEPVKPQQEANRAARVRGRPVLKTLLIAVACAGPLTLIGLWWNSLTIHAYGLVSAHVELLSAPVRSHLDAVYVEIGDRVRAGDTLYVLSSDEARGELNAAREALARERLATRPTDDQDPRRTIAGARSELTHAEAQAADADQRLAEVRRLLALDAATAGEERAALAAQRDAGLQADMARFAVERAGRGNADELDATRSRIAELESRIGQLRALAGPTEVHAQNDGIVQDLPNGPGSMIAKDSPVLSLIDLGSLWIDTYIPTGKARAVAHATVATVYPLIGGSRQAALSLAGWQEVRVPPQLRDSMPRDANAIRLRVQVDDPTGLTPGSIARVTLR